MCKGIRRVLSLLAVYTIALHTILWGLAPLGPAAAIDPLSVICHAASVSGDEAPADQDRAPSHACDHCNLCSATAPPPSLDEILVGQLAPVSVLDVLRPASAAPRASLPVTPKLARGPPQQA